MPDRSKTWGDGAGWIHQPTGVYYIRKRIEGHLYEVSTRCTSERAAHQQLQRFQANPSAYRPGGSPEGAVYLDGPTTKEFLDWSKAKGNTREHIKRQKSALGWWSKRIKNADLRTITAAELVRHLAPLKVGRKNRIATIKTFFSWLTRVEHRLAIDPVADALTVPQSKPQQWTEDKVIPRELYEAVRAKLESPWREAVTVLAGTGWHVTEMRRFAAGGRIDEHPNELDREKGTRVLLCPRTKGGAPLRTAVSPEVAAAAEVLLRHRTLSYWTFRDALIRASPDAAQWLKPGRFRHSIATWAINSGADPAAVAAFLGHRSPATTRKFYATHAVPAKVPTLS